MTTWRALKPQLQAALVDAFNEATFEQMLAYKCDKKLDRLTADKIPFPQKVFKVINAAEREGWLECLVRGAQEANKGQANLQVMTGQVLARIEAEGSKFYQVSYEDDSLHPGNQEQTQGDADENGIEFDIKYCLPTPPETLYERDEQIERVCDFLLEQREIFPVLAIVGLGGVGKTVALAKALEGLDLTEMDRIICIDMASQTSLVSAISEGAGLANNLQSVSAFIRDKKVLIILDSMNHLEDPNELSRLLSLLRVRDKGRVIITSQWTVSDFPLEESSKIILSTLTLEASRQCFLDYWRPTSDLSAVEQMELDVICGPSLLGGHPLALAVTGILARAYPSLTQLKGELVALHQRTEVLAEKEDNPLHNKLIGNSPWIALEAAFNRLGPRPQSLLCRLSLWPEMLGSDTIEFLSSLRPDMMVTANIKALIDHQLLLAKSRGVYDLHSLVRLYARFRLRDLPEAKHVYGETGKRLIRLKQKGDPAWIAGVTYLAEGGLWRDLIDEFQRQYQILNGSPLLQMAETNSEAQPALARYCLAWMFDQKRHIDEGVWVTTVQRTPT